MDAGMVGNFQLSSTIGIMGTLTKTLYETDFVEWAEKTAELLREKRFDGIDWEHLIEEVEGLAGADKHAVQSQTLRMLMHLVKLPIQPERAGSSWRESIVNARLEIESFLEASPSLRRYIEQVLPKAYRRAVKAALDETNLTSKAKELDIPETCPYTVDELLESDLNQLWPR
jgi:hypothetical protein